MGEKKTKYSYCRSFKHRGAGQEGFGDRISMVVDSKKGGVAPRIIALAPPLLYITL
jgi:hypothetical protein